MCVCVRVCVCVCVCRPVKTVKFSCDGKQVLSGSEDTCVKCWDLSTQSCLLTLRGHEVSPWGR